MDAHKLWMLRDFIGAQKVLFKIPVYQRNYDWSEGNCNRLLDDIKTIMDTGDKHFLGTIVFMAANGGGFSLQEYTIIDGQQRLTTIMLMLKALADAAAEVNPACAREISDVFLHNQYCDEEYKIKLKPIKSDNDQFVALLKDDYNELDEEGHIFRNYTLAHNRIKQWIKNGYTPQDILTAMQKLEIVEIVLTKDEDDPQIIFESINSTGLDLSSSDLIRNFLLMNAKNQDYLFETYWLSIEKALKKGTDYTNLNLFFSQYLVFKTNMAVADAKIYQAFVKLFKEQNFNQESCLKELSYYSEIFKAFVYDDSKYSQQTKSILKKIRQLKQTTCYPFLLHVFDDYEQGIIDEATLEQTLQFILSYLVRRMVCGIQSNTLRNLFRSLYNRVFKVSKNKNKYYAAINKFFYSEAGTIDTVPTDGEFSKALRSGDMYRNRILCKFLLMDIENGGSGKEKLNFENLTIEHIMPQMQSMPWMHITPEEHEEYLHVLGNLTITGYNSELSNNAFDEKKKIINEHSKAVILNSDVISCSVWDIEAIKARGRRLGKIVFERYAISPVNDKIEFEYLSTIRLDNMKDITGKKLVMFTFEGETYRQDRYAMMLFDIINLLDKKQPGKLDELAKNASFYLSDRKQHTHISTVEDSMRWAWKIREGVYIEANLSAPSIMKFIDRLFEEYELDKTTFSISIVSDGSEVDEDDNSFEDLTLY